MTPPKRGLQHERLVSVPELARARGVPYTTLWRTLRALADADAREHGRCEWMMHLGPKKKRQVNLSRLAAAHPALFARRYVTREDLDALDGRVTELEEGHREMRRRSNALASAVRDVRGVVKRAG